MKVFSRTTATLLMACALAWPALAQNEGPKQEVTKIAAAYADSFNKQDGAGIAAQFAKGGLHVNQAGPRADIAEFYQGLFKAGFDHEEITVSEVSPVGTDGAVGIGEFRISGKNPSGAPIEFAGLWTAAYVTEDGKLKIRLLTAMPKPPPAASK